MGMLVELPKAHLDTSKVRLLPHPPLLFLPKSLQIQGESGSCEQQSLSPSLLVLWHLQRWLLRCQSSSDFLFLIEKCQYKQRNNNQWDHKHKKNKEKHDSHGKKRGEKKKKKKKKK